MMSIGYEIAKHATCNPSNVMSAKKDGGHSFNITLSTPCDNGNLIAVGEWLDLDRFAEGTATTFEGKIVQKMGNGNYLVMVTNPGDAVLVYQKPLAAETWTNKWKQESNFYNEAKSTVRTLSLVPYDRFEVSAEGFVGEPKVNAEINGISNKKMVIAGA